jgi:hypothetical protein
MTINTPVIREQTLPWAFRHTIRCVIQQYNVSLAPTCLFDLNVDMLLYIKRGRVYNAKHNRLFSIRNQHAFSNEYSKQFIYA